MADPEGTNGAGMGCTGWFEVEAVIERRTGDNISEDEDETADDSGTDLLEFIDDSMENSIQADTEAARALFNIQEGEDDLNAVCALKRKFAACSQSAAEDVVDRAANPCRTSINKNKECTYRKRKIDELEDSGYGNTEVETQQMVQQVESQNGDTNLNDLESSGVGDDSEVSCETNVDSCENVT